MENTVFVFCALHWFDMLRKSVNTISFALWPAEADSSYKQ